jgi:peptidyl-tRNA hydrolase, PTH2 family
MEEIKQVIVLRADLDMGRGKLVAQGAHASLMSYLAAKSKDQGVADSWINEGEKKVVLKVDNEMAISELYKMAKIKKLPCALIHDAGLTQIPSGSITALGIGPWRSSELDILTGGLKLL